MWIRRLFLLLPMVLGTVPAYAEDWTIEQALKAAEASSPTPERVAATLRAARLARLEALARLGPTASVSANYLRNQEEVVLTLPTGENGTPEENTLTPEEQLTLKGTASLVLIDPAAYVGLSAARRAELVEKAAAQDTIQNFRLAVAGAYLDALVADARFSMATLNWDAQQERLERAKVRAEAGRERRGAILRLEADVLAAEQEKLDAQTRAAVARDTLRIYVGQDVTGTLAPVALTPEKVEGQPTQNPQLLAAQARLAQAKAGTHQALAASLPRVELNFTYQSVDPYTFTMPNEGEYWTATVNGSWTFFTSGMRLATVSRARANVQAAEASLKEAEQAVARDVLRLKADVDASQRLVEVAGARLKAAEQAAEVTRADYEEGAALLADVQAADASLAQARTGVVEAEARAARAILALRRAYGRL